MRKLAFLLVVCLLSIDAVAQSQSLQSTAPGAFFAALRTKNHISRSDSSHFNEAVDGVEAFFQAQHIVLTTDPLRAKFRIDATMSKESVIRVAADAGASSVLYLVVDRPTTSWMQLTLQCFDLQGKVLWEANGKAANAITSSGHVEKAVKSLTEKLVSRVGGACMTTSQPAAADVADSRKQ